MKRYIVLGILALAAVLGCSFMLLKPMKAPQVDVHSSSAITYRSVKNNSFKPGERMKFRVHYGMFNAGTAEFYIDNTIKKYNNRDCYHMHAFIKTAPSYEWFYRVRDDFHSYMDKDAILPWYYTRSSEEGDYRFKDTVSFDHINNTIKGTKGVFKMPQYTHDFMTAFYYARCLDLRNAKDGTVYKINTFLDDKVYNLGLTVIKREVIKTDFGKVRAIKIAPIMQSGRIFKDKDQMYIWVSDDENLMPLHVESPIIIGSIECDLIEFEGLRNPFTSRIKNK